MRTELVKFDKKNNIVSYSNNLVEARYSLLPVEQKLVFAMTSLISPDDEDFKTYRIDVHQLAEYMGIDKKSALRELDKVTDRLMSRVLRIPIDEGRKLLKLHWVSHCVLDKKIIEFSFHEKMKPYLLNLKTHFSSHKYRVIINFRGSYTIRIYQILKAWEYKGVCEYDLQEFRDMLGIGNRKYKEFKEFRRCVINPAKIEFEKKNRNGSYSSDVTFVLESMKTGRKITRLRFFIKKQVYQETLPFDFTETEKIISVVQDPQDDSIKGRSEKERNRKELTPERKAEEQNEEQKSRLCTFGVDEQKRKEIIMKYPEDYIRDNLDIVEKDYQSGKVKNLPAYTLAALKNDYRIKKSPYEIKQAEQKASAKKKAEWVKYAHDRLETLRRDFQSHRMQEALDRLSLEESKNLKNRFLQKQKNNRFFARWIEKGFESRAVQALYRSFTAEELLPEASEEEFQAFAKGKEEHLEKLLEAARSL